MLDSSANPLHFVLSLYCNFKSELCKEAKRIKSVIVPKAHMMGGGHGGSCLVELKFPTKVDHFANKVK